MSAGEPGRLVGALSACPLLSAHRTHVTLMPLLPLGPSGGERRCARTCGSCPTVEVVAAVALYVATHALDEAAYRGTLTLPSWVIFGAADPARQILTTLAAAVITVVGVVFSITIVTLTLASTQFGPRMLRNFIRDRGTQFTLGTFVATFVYATLVLVSIGPGSAGRDFVPHLSITVAVALVALSMARPDLLHPPHRDLDPAPAGDREHRPRPLAGDRRASRATTAGELESGPSVAELV